MKYIKKAVIETKALWMMITNILLSTISITINAKILMWISEAIANYESPMYWLTLIATGCVANTLLDIITTWTRTMSTHFTYTHLSNALCSKVTRSDYEMFTRYSPGEITTVHGNLWQLSQLMMAVLEAIKDFIQFMVTAIMILSIEIKLLVPIVVIYGIGGIALRKVIKKWGQLDDEMDAMKHQRNQEMDEIINGFAEVRSFPGLRKVHCDTVFEMNNSIIGKIKDRTRINISMNSMINIIDTVAMFMIMFYGISGLQSGRIASPATAVSLVMFCWRLIEPLVRFVDNLDAISAYKAPLPKFNDVMDYENKVSRGSINLNTFDREIKFDNVSFSYDESTYVLDGVSFNVMKGQHVGICGVSGGGKSTLLKLVPKFYDCTSGTITIDGIDLKDLTADSILYHVGIVHQNTYIFNGTIRENIKYARRGSNRKVTEMEMIYACKQSAIYDFIMSLPDGFDTNVGPRGLKLSGGQKQRIALARLFLINPDIIILDEATSALDNETERFVQESLEMFKDKTMIVVAHRLTTIKDFDKIVVIDQHKVAEEGTHDELMQSGGVYARMYK